MFFKKNSKAALISFCLLLSSISAQAEVQVSDAWLRLLPPVLKMTAAYMTMVSDQDDRLISVSSDVAKVIEIHQSKMENGVMSMQEVKCLFLPKDEPVELRPQSYHLMVMGLHSPLKEGESHQFTLEFENAGEIQVQVLVMNP